MCYIDYRWTWNITSLPKYWLSSWEIWCSFYKEIIISSGVFRRETARGFYPWGKAHSPSAKCEAFHFAPRLFFMFLFFIPLTIRQQSIIYPHIFSTDPIFLGWGCPKTYWDIKQIALVNFYFFYYSCLTLYIIETQLFCLYL